MTSNRQLYGQGIAYECKAAQQQANAHNQAYFGMLGGILGGLGGVGASVRPAQGGFFSGTIHPRFAADALFPNWHNLMGLRRSRNMKGFKHPFRRV